MKSRTIQRGLFSGRRLLNGRWLLRTLLLLFFLFLISLGILLGTTFGTQIIVQYATKSVTQLTITTAQGNLLSELKLDNIRWQSDNVSIAIDAIEIRPDWECLWRRELCLDYVKVQYPVIVAKQSVETQEQQEHSSTSATIKSPVPFRIVKLDLLKLNYEQLKDVEGNDLKQLLLTVDTIQGNDFLFTDEIDVKELGIGDIVLQGSGQDNSTNEFADVSDVLSSVKNWRYVPPTLSEFTTPIPLRIHEINVSKIENKQSSSPILLERLSAGIEASDSQLAVNIKQVEWQQWRFSTEAEIRTNLEFNVSIAASVEGDQTLHSNPVNRFLSHFASPMTLDVSASGSIQEVELSAQLRDGNQQSISELALNLMPQDRQLPVKATLSWASLPAFEGQLWRSLGGNIKAEGDLSNYIITLNTDNAMLSSLNTPVKLTARLSLHADSDSKKADLQQITVATNYGEMTTSGLIVIDEQPNFDLAFSSSELMPGKWFEIAATELSAKSSNQSEATGPFADLLNSLTLMPKGRLTGKWLSAQNWQASGKVDIAGKWHQHPLQVNNEFSFASHGEQTGQWQAELQTLQLQLADNLLTAKGHLISDNNKGSYWIEKFESDVKLNNLSQLLPGSRGELATHLSAKGKLTTPDINASAVAQDMAWQNLSLAEMSLDLNMDWQDREAFVLAGTMSGLRLSDELVLDGELQTQGDLLKHQIQLKSSSEKLSAQLDIAGGFTENNWSGSVLGGVVSHRESRFTLDNSAEVQFQWSPLDISIAPHCWKQGRSELCLEQLNIDQKRLVANTAGKMLPTFQWLSGLYAPLQRLETNSLVDFDSKFDWRLGFFPDANLSLSLSPGVWRFDKEEALINVETFKSEITLKDQQISAELTLQGPDIGAVDIGVALSSDARWEKNTDSSPLFLLDTWLAKSRVNGQFEAKQLSLKPVSQWLPNVQHTEGLISGRVAFKSHWSDKSVPLIAMPVIDGSLQLSDGALVTEQLGLHFTKLNQNLRFDGYKTVIDGEFALAGGHGNITGELGWEDNVQAKFNVTGNELGYQDYRGSSLVFSPDILFSFSDNVVKVAGTLAIPSANIAIQQLPESATLPSSDVQVDSEFTNAKTTSLPMEISVAINIDAEKKKKVRLEGYGLETALSGNLMLTGSPEKLALNGDINLLNGSYEAWGQQLLIREGQIIFSGPLEAPYLFAEAIRNPDYMADNVTAGLRIEGPIRKPVVSVFSQPELSQSQALSYLLRGRGLNSQQSDSSEVLFTGMLLNFGLSRSESRVTQIGQKFGVEDLSVELSGQSTDTKVAVSGTVLPGLKLSYGVGVFDAISEVSLRYQLLPQLYLEAVSGLTSTVDIHYEFDDDPKPSPPSDQ